MAASTSPKPELLMENMRTVSPTLAKYTEDTVEGELWKRAGLSPRDRSIATVSALIARNLPIAMPRHLKLALDNGVTPGELSEIIVHMAFYAGWPSALSAVEVAAGIFSERGFSIDQLPDVSPQLLSIEEVVPDEAIRAGFVGTHVAPVSPALAHYTDSLLYHEVWLRPGLAPRDRSLVSVCALIATGVTQFLPFYLGRAITHGLTKEEISELLAHLAFYSGWAASISSAVAVKAFFDSQSQ